MGAFGTGLLFGSFAISLLLGGGTAVVLYRASNTEAAVLRRYFGAGYGAYSERVPLLWPRLSLYHNADVSVFQPVALGRTVKGAAFFAMVVPAAEFVESGKVLGVLPSILTLF
jgi:hypothetical protein